MPTIRACYTEAARSLCAAGLPSPEPDAWALLEHVTGHSRSGLLVRLEEKLSAKQAEQLSGLLGRRLEREPLQYLLETVEWSGLRLRCDARALIPRPETEWLLHLALHDSGVPPNPRVLDVGTGTGALALGYQQARPTAEVWACDISAEALALARENAALNGLEVPSGLAIQWRQGDLLEAVQDAGRFHLILSNLPYLPEADATTLQPEVRRDPALALFGGPDGLAVARRLAAQAPQHLHAGGVMWLELDPRNAAAFAAELRGGGWAAETHADLAGRVRFVRAVWGGGQKMGNGR